MNQLVLKKKNELMKKKKGFTLVELIIVIAVIAVLAAVAIPKFGKVKEDANLRADQANAKIIATAVSSAVADGKTFSNKTLATTDMDIVKGYIDGNKVPSSKTDKAEFIVTYDSTEGVKITLGGTTKTPVYPAEN
ncbi:MULTISPECIES: prepilin-type N-terminal cleavage/methylation domain-containing protein [Clostridium]|uniref:prepilin-type N-terminal cleavage/methylation domain-containing protein n=1 Tax=Clostridium TaxID=1485 RepID=UPI0008A2775F|nr:MULTISPECIES: prepilin-type N-terminal cleavage/methylation domain-containing protein [Clostridium]OFS21064.1 pilin [Clostridium sp. HMSC19A10]